MAIISTIKKWHRANGLVSPRSVTLLSPLPTKPWILHMFLLGTLQLSYDLRNMFQVVCRVAWSPRNTVAGGFRPRSVPLKVNRHRSWGPLEEKTGNVSGDATEEVKKGSVSLHSAIVWCKSVRTASRRRYWRPDIYIYIHLQAYTGKKLG